MDVFSRQSPVFRREFPIVCDEFPISCADFRCFSWEVRVFGRAARFPRPFPRCLASSPPIFGRLPPLFGRFPPFQDGFPLFWTIPPVQGVGSAEGWAGFEGGWPWGAGASASWPTTEALAEPFWVTIPAAVGLPGPETGWACLISKLHREHSFDVAPHRPGSLLKPIPMR